MKALTGWRVRPAGTRLSAGMALVLFALLLFAGGRIAAPGRNHAYDPGATPPTTYRLTAGKEYQLSTATDLSILRRTVNLAELACVSTTGSAEPVPVSVLNTADDDRAQHVFATVRVPTSGPQRVTCTGVSEVFVDNADDASFDYAGLTVLLATLVGVLGVIVALGGGYDLGAQRPPSSERARVDVPERTVDGPGGGGEDDG